MCEWCVSLFCFLWEIWCVFVICFVVCFIDKLVEYLVIVGGIGVKFFKFKCLKMFSFWLRVLVFCKLISVCVRFLEILIGDIDVELVLLVIFICIVLVIMFFVMLIVDWKFVVYVWDML